MRYHNLAHIAFNISDMEAALNFYCGKLGLTRSFEMSFGTFYEKLKQDIANNAVPPFIDGETRLKELEPIRDRPWMVYLQAAPGQFLELFYTYNEEPLLGDTSQKCGYQHMCLEVEDIHQAWNELTRKGVVPTTEITLGLDGSYQFWIADPDGNRIELMQYTDQSLQRIFGTEG